MDCPASETNLSMAPIEVPASDSMTSRVRLLRSVPGAPLISMNSQSTLAVLTWISLITTFST